MGTFYRSQHELVFVWKSGDAPHLNNFELGQHGRNRTNVWHYAGVNTMRPGRLEELAMHPTVKPVAMIADAIKDCSRRGGLVLDPFCGSGTILIAAERTGRNARAIELDPQYVDIAVRRWQKYAGKAATLASETPETAARRALGSTRRSTEVRPGTVFSREWNGQMHRVTVLADGFAWGGKTYPSLSKVAFAITGSRWNGPRFFGLRDKQSKVPST